MKRQYVLMAVVELAEQEADKQPDGAALRAFADRLTTLYKKQASRAALAELSAAFDAGVARVIARCGTAHAPKEDKL